MSVRSDYRYLNPKAWMQETKRRAKGGLILQEYEAREQSATV